MKEEVMPPYPEEHEDERALVVSFKAGEAGAYRTIYARYSGRVSALCRRMLLNPDDAAEASQETFLRVYLALPRFNGRYQLGAWVSRIATNVCLDMLRARGRAPVRALSPIDLEALELEEPDEGRNPESSYFRSAEGRRVHATLASLSPIHRAAIVLREFEGFSYAEIALTLEMSEQQVKALLHRARGTFRRSWVSALSALFFPSKMWDRLKGVPRPEKAQALHAPAAQSQLGDFVASSANLVTSCSSVIQQCGHFMSERVAPLFVATAVGVAGGVAVASSPRGPAPRPAEVRVKAVDSVLGDRLQAKGRDGSSERTKPETQDEVVPPPTVAEAEPSPEPVVSPAGEAEEPAKPSRTGSEDPPPAEPEPEPLPMVTMGFVRNGPAQASRTSQHQLALDCPARSFSQGFTSQLSDGAFMYPVSVDLAVSDNTSLAFAVTKDGQQYQYRAWGAQPRATWLEEAGSVTIHIEGEYGPVGGPAPSGGGFPGSGPFTVDLEVDCATSAVVSETIELGGN